MEGSIIEVDGTLENPFVLAGVIAWTIFLTLLTLITAVKLWPRSSSSFDNSIFITLILLPFYIFTPWGYRLISSIIYCISAGELMGVGYWGKAPFWVAWLAGGVTLVWVAIRKRRLSI